MAYLLNTVIASENHKHLKKRNLNQKEGLRKCAQKRMNMLYVDIQSTKTGTLNQVCVLKERN